MSTFDRKFARLLLEICRYTYAAAFSSATNGQLKQELSNSIKPLAEPEKLILLTDDRIPSTSVACVATYPDKNIVSYMGTKTQFSTLDTILQSIHDWEQNAETLLVPFRLTTEQLGLNHPQKNSLGGRVHRGFLDELSAVQAKVVQTLLENGGQTRPVFVTGHSQGGAEAALATRALLAGGFPVKAAYTFAAARPGDHAFAQSIPATLPVYRIEFGNDIVPHLPPIAMNPKLLSAVELLAKLPGLKEHVKSLLSFLIRTTEKTGFVGAGRLCYGSHDKKEVRVDIAAEQEAELFNSRVRGLTRNPEHWAEHHHLAGTADDARRGVKGNYTALVSDFKVV
jgi:lipase (class 3)